jgi:hypothetical protein
MESTSQFLMRWSNARITERAALATVAVLVAIEGARMIHAPASDASIAAVVLLAALLSSIAGFAFAALPSAWPWPTPATPGWLRWCPSPAASDVDRAQLRLGQYPEAAQPRCS